MPSANVILRVAVPAPLYQTFDYLVADNVDPAHLKVGSRVRVPFGRTKLVGILLEVSDSSTFSSDRMKNIDRILDHEPAIVPEIQSLAVWASRYYHYPLGEVLAAALPAALRTDKQARSIGGHWIVTDAGKQVEPGELARAPRQAAALHVLQASAQAQSRQAIEDAAGGPAEAALRALQKKGLVARCNVDSEPESVQTAMGTPPELNDAQRSAVEVAAKGLGQFGVFLLDGVTGSGKTEVYIRLAEKAIQNQGQVLILVPEIGLTPQLIQRFRRRFSVPLAVLHSGLNNSERLHAWKKAKSGEARIVLGTRSAVFTPLLNPALLIVDEEHDGSFKQQEGFRYSARDLAVWRAKYSSIPVMLGSATPSLESLYNVSTHRYTELKLPKRVGEALPPKIQVIDVRKQRLEDGLSRSLLDLAKQHLEADGQVLFFLNRRGYAPILLCHDCGWSAQCGRCDARLVMHQSLGLMRCHHCGSQRKTFEHCSDCGGTELRAIGQGTERIEQVLENKFPDYKLLRIDRDSTRRKGSLEEKLAQARSGEARLLLGTQMLAKGHHFPGVTLVAILDADAGLYGADFRAGERMAQLIVQVAGRAGRAKRPGTVCIQTHHPDHPLLQTLLLEGYSGFARVALAERENAQFPPYTSLALLRSEATVKQATWDFLTQAKELAELAKDDSVQLWGPVAAPMERRGGRYRAQLLLHAGNRQDLQKMLQRWVSRLGTLPGARKVRWSIDVDPTETL